MLAASALVWLFSVVLCVVGLVFCLIRALRLLGLLMVGGSFFMWVLSMGMCAAATPPAAGPPAADAPRSAAAANADEKAPEEPLLEKPEGKWKGGVTRVSPMDDTKTISYSLEAHAELTGRRSVSSAPGGFRPILVVTCEEGKTELSLGQGVTLHPEFGTANADRRRHTVRIRFDDQPVISELWTQSSTNVALFAPSGEQLARRLARAKRLRVEYTPVDSHSEILEFDTTGAGPVVREIAKACGWEL